LKGYSDNIDKAVITVPAMFAARAREATIDAAKIAGLSGYLADAVELINEPTAAIFHYANLAGASVAGKVMVYDLGGGTFDVTIAEVRDKNVQVIHSEGNPALGGKDIDRDLLEHLSNKYNEQLGAKLNLDDIDYLTQAEDLKKALSSRESFF
jgi:molecular chaperone DnaK (HSP70)